MFLTPNNPETNELASFLHQSISEGPESQNYIDAHVKLDSYINSVVSNIYNPEQGFIPFDSSFSASLTNTQMFAIVYLGITNEFESFGGQPSYPVISAIETFRKENPTIEIPENISLVELAVLTYSTDFDLVFAIKGIEHIIRVVSQAQTEQPVNN